MRKIEMTIKNLDKKLLFSHKGHGRNRVVSKQRIQSKLLAGKKKANCKKSRAGKKKKAKLYGDWLYIKH